MEEPLEGAEDVAADSAVNAQRPGYCGYTIDKGRRTLGSAATAIPNAAILS